MAPAEKYAKCLIFPYDNYTFIPDSNLARSSLFRTKRTFTVNVPVDPAAGDAAGHFAFFVQPKLGDAGDPKQFQVGVLNLNTGYPKNLWDPANYVLRPNPVTTLPLDTNSSILTQPRPSCAAVNVPIPQTTGPPLVGWVDYQPVAGKQFSFNSNLDIYSGSGTWQNDSIMKIASGSYLLVVSTETVGAATVAAPLTVTISATGPNDFPGSSTLLNSEGLGVTKQTQIYSIAVTPNDSIRFSRATALPADVPTKIVIFVTPLFSPNYNLTEDYGMIERIRPVGLSVLTSCVMSQVKASGTIASTLTQPGQADKIFGSGASYWANVDGICSMDEYFRGPLAKGSYTWWKPAGPLDRDFYTVEEHNAREYPMILVAGNLGDIDGVGVSEAPIQVTVEFVYEVCQNTQLFEERHFTGSQVLVDAAMQGVGRLSSMTENPEHSSLLGDIANIMEQGSKFLPLLAFL